MNNERVNNLATATAAAAANLTLTYTRARTHPARRSTTCVASTRTLNRLGVGGWRGIAQRRSKEQRARRGAAQTMTAPLGLVPLGLLPCMTQPQRTPRSLRKRTRRQRRQPLGHGELEPRVRVPARARGGERGGLGGSGAPWSRKRRPQPAEYRRARETHGPLDGWWGTVYRRVAAFKLLRAMRIFYKLAVTRAQHHRRGGW